MPLDLALVAVAALIILAVLSAFISGIETALFSIREWRLHRWRKEDPKRVEQFERLMKNPREVLSVILLVDTIVNILLIILTVAIVRSITIPVPYWVKTLFLFALIVVACDLVPKVLALRDPFRFARQAILLLRFLLPLFGPLSRLTQRASELIASFFLPTKAERAEQFNDEELIALVELSAEQGQLPGRHRCQQHLANGADEIADEDNGDVGDQRTRFTEQQAAPRPGRRGAAVPSLSRLPALGVLDC